MKEKEKVENNEEVQVEEKEEKKDFKESLKVEDSATETKKELEETTDRLKRLMAEFDNFKKRSNKEREMLYSSLVGDIVTSFLPVIDNLEKAMNVETADENYKQGVLMVGKQFNDVLTSLGIEKIETVGKTFNPEYHEAVSSIQDENLGEQEITQEYRAGYKYKNRVLRHAMVVVAN